MVIVRHPFRQLIRALATVMLQVVRQPIAYVPVDRPVRLARVTERKVVRPTLQLPIQLVDQSRYQRAALTTIRHLADPLPLLVDRLLRRPPRADIAGRARTDRGANETCNPE